MIETGVALSTAFYTSVGGMSFGFSFLVVRWFAGFVAGRIDIKEARVDGSTQRLIAGLEKRLDAETLRGNRLEEEMIGVHEALRECERKHTASEEEVARLRGLMQGYGDAKQLAQLNAAADKAREGKR